jgi:hypothetical protein
MAAGEMIAAAAGKEVPEGILADALLGYLLDLMPTRVHSVRTQHNHNVVWWWWRILHRFGQ